MEIVHKSYSVDRRVGLIACAGGLLWLALLGCQATQPMPHLKCIYLTGVEHRWQAEYELQNGERLSVGPDLHVPVGCTFVFVLTSQDFIYTMAIPDLGVKEIAVPELEFRVPMEPTHRGKFALVGQELCGVAGPNGGGRLIVESPAEFKAWFARQ